ncbi:13825_t:CDS:2, partial [Funneliformis caledonium]
VSNVTSIEEQRLINKLDHAARKIFKVFYLQYECHQQLIWQYQAWPNETKLPLLDGKEEIKKLLEVIEYLTQEMDEQICLDDVVDILKTKELIHFALTDLVVRGLIQEDIILQKSFEGSTCLSSSIFIASVVPGAQASANMQIWYYFVK